MMREAKVAVSPGIGFGEYGDGFVRIALPILPEASALVTLAQAGNTRAAATGYALPK